MQAAALAIPAISSIFGGIMGSRQTGAQKAQTAALQQYSGVPGAQTDLAKQIGGFANGQMTMAMPAISKAMQYYTSLTGGGKQAFSSAIAPDVAGLTDTYNGAQSGIEARTAPGAGRDMAIANLMKQRAGQIGMAGITARNSAFGNLASMGGGLASSAAGLLGQQGGLLNNMGDQRSSIASGLYGMQQNQRNIWGQVGQNLGNMYAPLLFGMGTKGKSGTGWGIPSGMQAPI